jgi:CubicO group peptidase (beta-lactamase class C family)
MQFVIAKHHAWVWLASAGLVISCGPARGTDEFAGQWTGLVGTNPGQAFNISLQHDSLGGSFDMPGQGIVGFPLGGVRIAGDSLVLRLMAGTDFTVHAVLAGDSIIGSVELPDGQHPIRLGRNGSALARSIESELRAEIAVMRARPLDLVEAGPGLQTVDRHAVDQLMEAAQAANTDALVLLHDGALVGEWHREGASRRIETMSVTKAVLNLAAGRLIGTGAIPSLDTPVHHYFPEWAADERARITLRHLLSHTSGLHSERTTGAIYSSSDFVRHALEAPLVAEPGTAFFYNNNATNLLAGTLSRVVGAPMDQFLRDDLFLELGIRDFVWQRDASGNPHGMSGLQVHGRDLARLGQLVLDRGRHGQNQLIEESWFAESLQPASTLSASSGLLWWLLRENSTDSSSRSSIIGYRADGHLGQYLVIFPAERLVGVRMITNSPAYQPDTDGFVEFPAMLRRLVPRGSPP